MEIQVSQKFASIPPSATLAIDSKYKEMKKAGEDVIGFGAGEPDFDTPEHIRESAIHAINTGVTKYTPASGTIEIKDAVVRKFKRENGLEYTRENIVVSNGAKHSLMNAFGVLLNPGDEVILPAPYWVSYFDMIRLNDGVPVILTTTEEKDFKFNVEDLNRVYTEKTKALVLNTPSNPTGMVYTDDELKAIADWAVEKGVYVISDEIYEHLVYDGSRPRSIASFGEEIREQTIIVNGVSKTFAMTGWRIGYLAATAKLAKAISNVQSHATSNPNSIAQAATITALDGPMDGVEEMKKAFCERRNYMVERINQMDGVSCRKPQGAFYVMMNIKALIGKKIAGTVIQGSEDFARVFLDEFKVAVVPCVSFGAEGFVRWSYATSMENIERGLDRLEQLLATKEG